MNKGLIRVIYIILWLGLPIIIWLVVRSSAQGIVMASYNVPLSEALNIRVSGWVVFGSLGYVGMLCVFHIMSWGERKGEKGLRRTITIIKKADMQEAPIWKEPPFIFAILVFPSIVLFCLIFYLIQVLILE